MATMSIAGRVVEVPDNLKCRMSPSSESGLRVYFCVFFFTASLVASATPVGDGWAEGEVCDVGLRSPVSHPVNMAAPLVGRVAEPPDNCLADSLSQSRGDDAAPLRHLPNTAFHVGERLIFSVEYGPVKAGQATMEVSEIAEINGRKCYHLISEARTNELFSNFFEVRDRVESFVDVDGLFPWRFEKHLREGDFRSDVSVEYDQVNHRAITDKDTMEVPPFVQDILSAFYYGRIQDLTLGKSIFVDNHSGSKMYPLEVKVLKIERVKVPAGVFTCVVIEPLLQTVGIFKQRGKLRVWLTDDERKMPVLMRTKMVIGSVEAKLVEYDLGEKN